MPTDPRGDLRASFLKVLVLPALTFLLIPLLTVAFCAYGERQIDGMILASIGTQIDGDASLDEAGRAQARSFFQAHPPSAACADPDPALDHYRGAVCRTWGETWQFTTADRLARAAILVGLAAFLAIGILGLVAFRDRRAQHWSFMVGWRGLVAVTAAETVAQGVLAVWLSYWGTALFFERYYPKLILVAAVAAGAAVLAIVAALLRRVPPPEPLEAERIGEAEAPGLWRRVKDLAQRLGTEPPATIAVGIDDNFFVTEQALPLTDGTAGGGRLLYVSLPLLRTLSAREADAVFGHELAHFKGGDTAASARLHPALVRYQAYAAALETGGLTYPAFCVMRLYRAIFELALRREQRRRELLADTEAARLTSPEGLARSLLKISGYSSFRARTEEALFEQRGVHQGSLDLQARIQAGLAAHAASPAFLDQVQALRVPHPFDSHPPLQERLANVGTRVQVSDAAALLQAPPEDSWADQVLTAREVEGRLWGAYEARFKANHELSLAWRYLPASDAEREHVLRFFPDLTFAVKGGGQVTLTHRALTAEDGAEVVLAEIQEAKVRDGTFSRDLVLKVRAGEGKPRTVKLKLKPLGGQEPSFKEAFGRYWQRDQAARQSQ